MLLSLVLLRVNSFLRSGLIPLLVFLVIFLILLPLLKEGQDIEILFLEEYLLFLEAFRRNLSLFFDRFWASIDFLQNYLHHRGLEFGQKLHLFERFLGLLVCDLTSLFPKFTHRAIFFVVVLELLQDVLVGITLTELLWSFDTLDDSFGVLIFLLLNMFLDMLWIVTLQTIRLYLESIVEICKILDKVVDCLRSLLFFGQRHLKYLTNHTIHIFDWVVSVSHLLLNNQACRFKGTIERNVSWILHLLVVVSIERHGLFILLLNKFRYDGFFILICFIIKLTQNFILLIWSVFLFFLSGWICFFLSLGVSGSIQRLLLVEAWSILLLFFLLFWEKVTIFVGLHVIFELHFGTLIGFVK